MNSNWIHTLALVAHVLLAASIIGLVLLQRGRGADAGAGFGAGASGTVFGARGSASFLSRMTATMAALFFVTSLTLAYLGGQTSAPVSILDVAPASPPVESSSPALPANGPEGAAAGPQPTTNDVTPTTSAAGDEGSSSEAPAVEPEPGGGAN